MEFEWKIYEDTYWVFTIPPFKGEYSNDNKTTKIKKRLYSAFKERLFVDGTLSNAVEDATFYSPTYPIAFKGKKLHYLVEELFEYISSDHSPGHPENGQSRDPEITPFISKKQREMVDSLLKKINSDDFVFVFSVSEACLYDLDFACSDLSYVRNHYIEAQSMRHFSLDEEKCTVISLRAVL